jgi:hypothetical protein
MRVSVNIPSVKKNITNLSHIIKEESIKDRERLVKYYSCYVNRKTGDLYFPAGEEASGINLTEWKPLKLIAKIDDRLNEALFSLNEESEKAEAFNYGECAPLANQVMEQMIKILNSITYSIHPKTMRKILDTVASLQVEFVPILAKGKEFIESAFYDIDRYAAERLLSDHVVGTYLFRKDSYVFVLEKALPVTCYTLTYLSRHNKIVDLTIVNKEDRWYFFDNDLTFSGPSYPSIDALLDSLGPKLCTPLYHDKRRKW